MSDTKIEVGQIWKYNGRFGGLCEITSVSATRAELDGCGSHCCDHGDIKGACTLYRNADGTLAGEDNQEAQPRACAVNFDFKKAPAKERRPSKKMIVLELRRSMQLPHHITDEQIERFEGSFSWSCAEARVGFRNLFAAVRSEISKLKIKAR
jgi:hypothetical protein